MSTDKAAAYARFSTDRQDARSIDDQLRRCRAFAESRGLTIAAEFKDAAVSGAHTERADLQRLLEATRARGGPPFAAVIVDDLSRLSRDLGNTWDIIFNRLATVGVRVIDATTGMASDGAGARLTFGAMALVNDTFMQLVRTETHRGLEGRALAGFSTGGRIYGYTTRPEPNPPDPEHPRHLFEIVESEAAIVRRVFRAYVDGHGVGAIASTLNAEGIAAPYDGTRAPKLHRGWGSPSIRKLLRNERYIGRFVWNKHKYVPRPGGHTRRAVERPVSEWRVLDRPELAIVDADFWEAVQARLKGTRRGRPAGAGKHPHLLSGIARCACGGPLSIVGVRTKDGVPRSTFGCSRHATRGDAGCSNRLTIPEDRLNEAIIGALRDVLLEPDVLARFVTRFYDRLNAAKTPPDVEAAQVERQIRQSEAAVRNLTEAVAQAGWSDALKNRLREEEGRLRDLQRRRVALGRPQARLPEVSEVEGYARDLIGTLETDATRGREILKRYLGTITLTPEPGGYLAAGAFNVLALVSENSPGVDPQYPD